MIAALLPAVVSLLLFVGTLHLRTGRVMRRATLLPPAPYDLGGS